MSDTRIDGYRDFLRRRDGEADLLNRRLANREDFFDGLETNPVRSVHPADRTTFLRNMRRRKPEPGLDRKMLFLLATAKLNQAERFGVGLGETYGLNSDENLPPERVYLELEEHYHTRLLAYVLDVFDLTFQVVPPPFVMRQFVKTGSSCPSGWGSSSSARQRWPAASCSTNCAASVLNYSPTNPKSVSESSGYTAKSSPTRSDTSATARRDARQPNAPSCVGSTPALGECLRAKPPRSACSLILTTCVPDSTGHS